MRKLALLIPFCAGILNASEPSAFGAGDLNNPNPYGLTREEQLILQNKKELQTVVQQHNAQSEKVQSVEERLDGIQTIVEGLTQSSAEQRLAVQKLSEKSADNNDSETILALQKEVAANTEAVGQLRTLLEELSHVVDGINADYVTKDQFTALIKQLKLNLPAATAAVPSNLDNTGIEKEAHKLFDQKKYAEAQSYFEQMVHKKYKQAEALFMIGETLYERGEHKRAINYYKDSATRNEKALYMPTLLLHTGVSMEKSGDKASAKAFYQATVTKYANTGAAKEAAERLSKLK